MKRRYRNLKLVLALAVSMSSFSGGAFADEKQASKPSVLLELNAAASTENGCKLTFVVQNSLATEVSELMLETVLFDTDGQVILLTLFDFGTIPISSPRVRQFDVPGAGCERLKSVLINGVQSCKGDAACAENLEFRSRTKIGLLG